MIAIPAARTEQVQALLFILRAHFDLTANRLKPTLIPLAGCAACRRRASLAGCWASCVGLETA